MSTKKYHAGTDTCSEEGCNQSPTTRGMCQQHYMAFYHRHIRTGNEPKIPTGPTPLAANEKKRRIALYVNPALAALLDADDIPEGIDRIRVSRRRKQEAAEMLFQANIDSRIL